MTFVTKGRTQSTYLGTPLQEHMPAHLVSHVFVRPLKSEGFEVFV